MNDISLNLSEGNEGLWTQVQTHGQTPGKRYGHSMSYVEPFFVLFGGSMLEDVC